MAKASRRTPVLTAVEKDSAVATGKMIWLECGPQLAHADLCAALEKAFLGWIKPKRPTPTVALTRAVEAVRGHGQLRCTVTRGIQSVHDKRQVGPETLAVSQRWSAKIVVDRPSLTVQGMSDEAERNLREELESAYQAALVHLTAGDVSAWFRDLLSSALDGIALNGGHAWFVPAAKGAQLQAIGDVLRTVGYEVVETTVTSGDNVLQSAARAIEAEMTKAMAELEAFVMAGDEMSAEERCSAKRMASLRTNQAHLKACYERVARYERAVFASPLYAVEKQLEAMRLKLGGAAIKVDGLLLGQEAGGRQIEIDDRPAAPMSTEWTSERARVIEFDDRPAPEGTTTMAPEGPTRMIDLD